MLDSILHKEVRYRTHGRDLSFFLSMGLFSSNDIDSGSILLIDHIIDRLDLSSMDEILDAGCGVGTLGVTLGALYGNLRVTATDRDALALTVTEHNAQQNGVSVKTAPGLDTLIWDADEDAFTGRKGAFDLVMTNIPAKAGAPVLRRFLVNGLHQLTDGGTFAFVIVDTLRDFAQTMCEELPCIISSRHDGPRHSVFLIKRDPEKMSLPIDDAFPGVYLRESADFSVGKTSYPLDTVYSIPGFDTVPYEISVSLPLAWNHVSNSVTVWNPGQGHAAAGILAHDTKGQIGEIHLAGRDLLALLISRHSLSRQERKTGITISHIHSITELLTNRHMLFNQKDHLLHITADPIPRIPFRDMVESSYLITEKTFKPSLIITAKSSVIAAFSKKMQGFSLRESKKKHGFRAIYLQNLY